MTDKKGRTNQQLFSATSNYDPKSGAFTGKTPSKVGEVGESVFNLGQSDKYWMENDIYGIKRLAGWGLVGVALTGIAIGKAIQKKKTVRKDRRK